MRHHLAGNLVHVGVHQNHMAATFHLVLSCPSNRKLCAEAILTECQKTVASLEADLSEFVEESPVSRLNRSRVGERVAFSPEAFDLLHDALEVERITNGAFSCFAKSPHSYRDVLGEPLGFDENTLAVWKKLPVHLGFGAIGKGYALDKCRERIVQENFHDYVLSVGGSSIILSGFSSLEQPWTWGWSWVKNSSDENSGLEFRHDSGIEVALGISGSHEKGSHIIDPNSGNCAVGPRSALVAHPSAMFADASSTALYVMGWDRALDSFKQVPNPPALAIIDEKGIGHWNGTFERIWGRIQMGVFFLFSQLAQEAFGEESVQLETLGMEDFTPYIVERDFRWILLPVVMIFLVLLHLQKHAKFSQPQEEGKEA